MMQWITKEENNGSIKIKTINIIKYQNGGTENKIIIFYETEMEAQRI